MLAQWGYQLVQATTGRMKCRCIPGFPYHQVAGRMKEIKLSSVHEASCMVGQTAFGTKLMTTSLS